jgi:nitrogen fixation protein NifU and related proteins
MAIKYSEKVMDHFSKPRNVGELENPDGLGEVGNPSCGDIMTFYINVDDKDVISDIKFKTFGCGAAIAVSSMMSEMAKGKSIEDALKISNKDVANELEGLPGNKMHCSNLGADALHAAIESYKQKKASGSNVPEKVVVDHDDEDEERHEDGGHTCPSCDVEVPDGLPSCNSCGCDLQDEDK